MQVFSNLGVGKFEHVTSSLCPFCHLIARVLKDVLTHSHNFEGDLK